MPTGTWHGVLEAPNGRLGVEFVIEQQTSGAYSGTMAVPQQRMTARPLTSVLVRTDSVYLVMSSLRGQFQGRLSPDGQQLAGRWQQNGASLPLSLQRGPAPAVAVAPIPTRPQTPKAPFPYRSEEVSVRNAADQLTLAGTLTLPQGKGPFAAVVLVTGSGPQDRNETVFGHQPFLVLADYLTRRGIAVLRYDDRGVGQSERGAGGATTENFTRDAQAAMQYLRTRPDIQPKRVGLIGHSEGGLIGWMAAAQPNPPAFLVSLAGTGVSGAELLLRQQTDLGRAGGVDTTQLGLSQRLNSRLYAALRQNPALTAAQLAPQLEAIVQQTIPGTPATASQSTTTQLLSPWMRYIITYDPQQALRQVHCPVLALNGSKDLQVAAEVNLPAIEKGLRAAGNRDVTTRTLPGLNHLFQTATTGSVAEYATLEETFAPVALQTLGDWLVQHTK
ncbi:alpha/beta fold hydrolase [Hymenobacter algoricola]|uniref:Alpha/beta fold hydrolase n=2 Tax=Hymenobacter algoricola TaxID=486267 RepID=A0ABP7NRS0_9BACT